MENKNNTIKNLQEKYGEIAKTYESILMISQYEDRTIHIGAVDEDLALEVRLYVKMWNDEDKDIPVEERKPIKFIIDSCGGELNACFSIVDTIENSLTPVYTYNVGKAYSAGGIIFISGKKRFSYPRSSFLWHLGSAENSGDAHKFINFNEFYKRQLKKMCDIVLNKTKVDPNFFAIKERDDWWMDADEQLEYGFTDEITKEIY